jgi:predicted Zn finger-like uncharacterized protein
MKIVCDNCATKYSIADEKVRGKVFKIRCKKCSHIIVVKGTEGGAVEAGAPAEAPAAEAPAEAAGGADGWHVVINGEQVGPLQPAEVRAKFRAGEIDVETYAWREGFGDWQRLGSIDEFSDLQPAAPPPDATKRSSNDDLFGSEAPTTAGNNDLFGAPSGDLFAGGTPTPTPAGGGGGLFAQPEPAAPAAKRAPTPGFGVQAHGVGNGGAPAGADAKMTGQRNESSVLFSLNNLQALASGSGGAKAPAPAAAENRPGFANSQTEGSGLIDIRAMAAATLSSNPSPSEHKNNDLPSFSSAPVFSPIAAPILMPAAPSGPPRWIWPVIGLGVLAVASILVVGILLLTKKNDTVAVAPTAAAATPGAPAAPGTPPTTAPAAAPGAAAPTTTPAAAAAAPAEAKADKGSSHESGSRDHHGKSGSKSAAAAPTASPKGSAPAPAAAEPAPAAPKKSKKGDDLDDLLNGATSDRRSSSHERSEAAASNDDNLPDQLDKGAIVAGMGKVKGKVQGCYEQFKVPGIATVAVTIAKSGKVSSASVNGSFAGTPTGDCVAKAVRGATFSPFKGAAQTINYPYSLR